MPVSGGSGGKSSGAKGGSSGQASNAALQDDEDIMMRRGKSFRAWVEAHKKKKVDSDSGKGALMTYPKSNMPAGRPAWNPPEGGS